MRKLLVVSLFATVAGLLVAPPGGAQSMDLDERWWLEGGIGASQVETPAAVLPGQRGGAVLSVGGGFRPVRELGFGIEYSSNAPFTGCQRWDCDGDTRNFKPGFNRLSAFGELRLFQGKVRLRYGVGDVSYCYRGRPSFDLWNVLFNGNDTAYSSCDSVSGFAKSASIGFHWMEDDGAGNPMAAGLRLGVEEADFKGRARIDLPAFRYRAATLTLQLSLN